MNSSEATPLIGSQCTRPLPSDATGPGIETTLKDEFWMGAERSSVGCGVHTRIDPSRGGAVPLSVPDGVLGVFKEGGGSGLFTA
jgi:hypothetical protein